MHLIVGAGLAGLTVGKRVEGIIVEEQPRPGGVFVKEEILGHDIPLIPPLIWNTECISTLQGKLRLREFEAVWFGKGEIGLDNVEWVPQRGRNFALVENLTDFLSKLASESRIVRGRILSLKNKRVLLSNGKWIQFEDIYNAGSRNRLGKLLGIDEGLDSLNVGITLMISEVSGDDWNIVVPKGASFRYAVKLNIDKLELLYAFSFYQKNDIPSNLEERVISEARRKSLIGKILAVRHRVISEGVLLGEPKLDLDHVHNCGRLGEWKNYDICSTLKSAESC
jgi:hypothetical protein